MKHVADINKHKDEFRLRILVSNICNRKCPFCLNDFQSKIGLPEQVDVDLAKEYIRNYGLYMAKKKEKAIVNISGGEPGIYNKLGELITCAIASDVFSIINTNGAVFHNIDWFMLKYTSGMVRVHVLPGQLENYKEKMVIPVEVQAVYGDHITDREAEELVSYYTGLDIPIKFFVDFHGNKELNDRYAEFITSMRAKYPDKIIKARFTGIQQNRGIGCKGCENKCITLKALWLFPDGTTSTCPQLSCHRKPKAVTRGDIREHIDSAYKFHMTGMS